MERYNMSEKNGRSPILMPLVSLLATVALSLSAFNLKWTFDANANMATMQQTLDAIKSDTESDKKQNESLSKHWKLHGWARDRITELRHMHDLELIPWPDLHIH